MLASLAPDDRESLPRLLEAWGGVLESVIPNVRGFSELVAFPAAAWLTLVVMWTLMPLSVWWVIRGDWVFQPNLEMLRRKPSILIILILLLASMAVGLAVLTPTPDIGAPEADARASGTDHHQIVVSGAQCWTATCACAASPACQS